MSAMVCLFSRTGREQAWWAVNNSGAGCRDIRPARRAAMTMQEGSQDPAATAGRQPREAAYFLDLLGDSHQGLGHPEAAIEAYRQAADRFRALGAECSYALCLLKTAESYLSLGEPWHAVGYLEACVPLLRDLGLTRHEGRARQQLDACQAELARAHLLGEGGSAAALTERSRPATNPKDPQRTQKPQKPRRPGQLEQCRRIRATRVDSCYARDRRTAALAEP
jgi:tetratricopeptide (TPR) repeat protein